jgi:hypothetical protein
MTIRQKRPVARAASNGVHEDENCLLNVDGKAWPSVYDAA